MSEPTTGGIDTTTKVDLLLREYDTLRQEVISRTNNRFAILGLLGTVVAFVCTQTDIALTRQWVVVVVFLVVLWWIVGYTMRKIGTYLAAVERRINELAGEKLLRWGQSVGDRALYRLLYLRACSKRV